MKLKLISTALMFVANGAMAQHAHSTGAPSETGQSQFAAIAEIVSLLRDDPKTDWGQVDISALREHLVDMNNVTTLASVTHTKVGPNITFTITGDEVVAASVKRMVLAHSSMLETASDWVVSASEIDGGASMNLQTSSADQMAQVSGLGFFGLMTIGAHHQQHHLMIASGKSPH